MMRRFNFNRAARRWGSQVVPPQGDSFYAFVHPLRYMSRMYLEQQNTPIGSSLATKFLYIGPAHYDITKLSPHETIAVNGADYCVLMSEPVWFAGAVEYYRAILAKRQV